MPALLEEVAQMGMICAKVVSNAMAFSMKVTYGRIVQSGIVLVPVLEMTTDEARIIAAVPEAAQEGVQNRILHILAAQMRWKQERGRAGERAQLLAAADEVLLVGEAAWVVVLVTAPYNTRGTVQLASAQISIAV